MKGYFKQIVFLRRLTKIWMSETSEWPISIDKLLTLFETSKQTQFRYYYQLLSRIEMAKSVTMKRAQFII